MSLPTELKIFLQWRREHLKLFTTVANSDLKKNFQNQTKATFKQSKKSKFKKIFLGLLEFK
jgi:hypothetical protein